MISNAQGLDRYDASTTFVAGSLTLPSGSARGMVVSYPKRTKPTMKLMNRRRARSQSGIIGALVIGLAASLAVVAPAAATAASPNLVVNGDFSQGTKGWTSNRPATQPLSSTTAGRTGAGAMLKTSTPGVIVLNDAVDTVSSTKAGETYTLTVWARSARAATDVLIKAREGRGNSVYVHQQRVRLTDTAWHRVALTFTTRTTGSKIDMNVLFIGTVAGQSVFVDDVSLVGSSASTPTAKPTPKPTATTAPKPTPTATTAPKPAPTAAPKPAPTATQAPAPTTPPVAGACTRPTPSGTEFGSSLSTSGQTAGQSLAGVDAIFGKLPVVRVFDPGMVMPWDKPRTGMLAGRDLVISFRPMPQDVLSGKYDAELAAWFAQAPSDVTIYWSYIHEPEPLIANGTFTADQYRRAWQHIDAIADKACRSNMYATLILTGWTTLPAAQRDWRDYYAGGDVIDVMAFDPYNGASNPTAVTSYPSAASIFDSVVKVAAEAGKPYGIAETGSPKIPSDASGSQRAAWLADVAAYHRKHGALFVTYFHSSRDGEWRLLDAPSQTAWRAAVASSN